MVGIQVIKSVSAVSLTIGLAITASTIGVQTSVNRDGYSVAQTQGMNKRQDRRDDRQGDRTDRRDDRQDCRQDEGAVGKDKRDCKQDERQDRNDVDSSSSDDG